MSNIENANKYRENHFLEWMKTQPLMYDPTAFYAESSIKKFASTLRNIGNHIKEGKYKNLNGFDIDDYESISDILALLPDDKKLKVALEFYKRFLFDEVNPNYDYDKAFKEKLNLIIKSYKLNFSTVVDGEKYKWKAIKCFSDNWYIEADDFKSMFKDSFFDSADFTNDSVVSAYDVLMEYLEYDSVKVKCLFELLFDENISLDERYCRFTEEFQKYVDSKSEKENNKNKIHGQDSRMISIYLTFRYPQKYYIYKSREYEDFINRMGYNAQWKSGSTKISKLQSYFEMCDRILDEVKNDEELINLNESRYEGNVRYNYDDENLHLLVSEIVIYASRYLDEDDFAMVINGENVTIGAKDDSKEINFEVAKEFIDEDDFNRELYTNIKKSEFVDYEHVPHKAKGKIESSITTYKRSRTVASNALAYAKYQCEYDPSHESFIRKHTNIKYMEPHHLVPLYASSDFPEIDLDREPNIVSLCSNCHNWIHYGKDNEKILRKLYDERKNCLKEIGIDITFEELMKYYK